MIHPVELLKHLLNKNDLIFYKLIYKMFIIYTEYPAHCIYNVILGICKNMNEVAEIIWNFSRLILKKTGNTFEENGDIVKIAKISKDDFSILERIYKKYEDELDELKYSEDLNGWEPEVFNVYF